MFAAYSEAIDLLNRDKENAAKIYLQMTNSKESLEAVLDMLNDKETEFTVTPSGTMSYVDFMYKIGLIKNRPVTWKDLFFPEVHQLLGK